MAAGQTDRPERWAAGRGAQTNGGRVDSRAGGRTGGDREWGDKRQVGVRVDR